MNLKCISLTVSCVLVPCISLSVCLSLCSSSSFRCELATKEIVNFTHYLVSTFLFIDVLCSLFTCICFCLSLSFNSTYTLFPVWTKALPALFLKGILPVSDCMCLLHSGSLEPPPPVPHCFPVCSTADLPLFPASVVRHNIKKRRGVGVPCGAQCGGSQTDLLIELFKLKEASHTSRVQRKVTGPAWTHPGSLCPVSLVVVTMVI